jgi:SAM-dependent methyltransferase
VVRSDYFAHERQYQLRRAAGKRGWGSTEDTEESIGYLQEVLGAGYTPQQGRLLELGCGAGDNALWLAAWGFEVYGVDLSPTAVAWAGEKARNRSLQAVFEVGDVLTLDNYPDGFFDFVLDGCCLHCIIGPDRGEVLKNARRVLKPGGFFFVMTMCNDPVNEAVKAGFDRSSRCWMHGDLAVRYFGLPQDILEEIRAAGFRLLNWEVKFHRNNNEQDMLLAAAARCGG